ncbi:sulfite exporter TauE/SafE family protein [Thalassolituus sp. LLYu03]|uniref:sulfite exporter TauE/SafE family protein n=1 Tax=Thalassolituus sp. LLYu03 TaxID=3421656 RepID=UPI003D27623F
MDLSSVDLTFLLVTLTGVLITGISKSGFGGGIGVVAVPMMAPFIGGEAAIGILLPVLLLMDALTIRIYRRWFSWQLLKPVVPGIVIGIFAGAALLGVVSDRGVQAIIGVMGIWVLAQRVWPALGGAGASGQFKGHFLGGLAGVGSVLAHAGAAPMQAYNLTLKISKEEYLAQMAVAFGVMNAIKLIPYGYLGLLNMKVGWLTLLLIPMAFVGTWLGRWLSKRVDSVKFFRLMMVLLAVNSVYLLGRAVTG